MDHSSGTRTVGYSVSRASTQQKVVRQPPSRDLLPESIRNKPIIRKINQYRDVIGRILDHKAFQEAIVLLIVGNSVLLGVATFDFVTDDPQTLSTFEKIDKAFLIVFTAELGLHFTYLDIRLFKDGWLNFDCVVIACSWLSDSAQVFRAFRVVRTFRLVSRTSLLRDLVLAIFAVLPRMYAIAALLLLIFYIYSVLFTTLFSDLDLETNYFRTLDASLFTCMEMMTLEWAGIAREVLAQDHHAWASLMSFISITGFIVFNLIVAVICDAVRVMEKERDDLENNEVPVEVKLARAQERINYLSQKVESLLTTQKHMRNVLDGLALDGLAQEMNSTKEEGDEKEV